MKRLPEDLAQKLYFNLPLLDVDPFYHIFRVLNAIFYGKFLKQKVTLGIK